MRFLVAVLVAATASASGGCLQPLRRGHRAAPERPQPREQEDHDCDTPAPVREPPSPAAGEGHDGEQQGTRVDPSVYPQRASNHPPAFSSPGSSYGGNAFSPGSSYGALASSPGSSYGALTLPGSSYGGLASSPWSSYGALTLPGSSYGGLASSPGSSYDGLAFSPGSSYGGHAFFPGGQPAGGILLGNTVGARTRPAHKTGASSSLQPGQLYSPSRQLSFSSPAPYGYLQPAFQNNYGLGSPLQSFAGFPSLQAASFQPPGAGGRTAASASNKAQFPGLHPGYTYHALPALTVQGVRPQHVTPTTARPRPEADKGRHEDDSEESRDYSRESDDEDDSSETSGEATEELLKTSQSVGESSYDPEEDGPDRATSFAVEDIFKPSPKDYYSSSFHSEEPFGPSRRGKGTSRTYSPKRTRYPGDSEVQHSEHRPEAVDREVTQEDKKRDYYSYSVVTHKRTR